MLPINHLKKTLDRCCGQWEFEEHPSGLSNQFPWIVLFLNTNLRYKIEYDEDVWLAYELKPLDGTGKYLASHAAFLSDRLNGLTRDDDGKPTPLVTTDLLTGKKGLLSFATQELKDDFLRHAAPVMDTPDKEAAE